MPIEDETPPHHSEAERTGLMYEIFGDKYEAYSDGDMRMKRSFFSKIVHGTPG